MGAQGTASLNFGAHPGSGEASVTVTGQTGIQAGSLVEAWVFPATTADHTSDEHWTDPPLVYAAEIVPGTGFTIRGRAPQSGPDGNLYGIYNIAWVWN